MPSAAALAIGCALSAAQAQAQENSNAAPRSDQLEEVVVTATRQTDTVNRVALSVSAQTQRSMDQQGIRTIADLQGAVPALNGQAMARAGALLDEALSTFA